MANWIAAIDLAEWHQQTSVRGEKPAMMTDPAWHGFGDVAEPVVTDLMCLFPDCVADQWMLSAVMPGHSIEPHVDHQPAHWLCRVHVPLLTNEHSHFLVAGKDYSLRPGNAYRVNTEAVHSVANDGPTPRIHLMFDVKDG